MVSVLVRHQITGAERRFQPDIPGVGKGDGGLREIPGCRIKILMRGTTLRKIDEARISRRRLVIGPLVARGGGIFRWS
jgi:hypothetical protein